MPKVIVLGGGVAGLTAAHELVERGFEVHVYDRDTLWGGKARSYGDPRSATDGRQNLPAEHGFRFFPGFYKHVTDTMRRIPIGAETAFDHLVPTSEVLIAQQSGTMLRVPARFPQNGVEWASAFSDWRNRTDIGIPHTETSYFAGRLLEAFTACQARRFATYEYIAWWTYVGAASRSRQYQKLLGVGLTRSLVAMKAEQSNARTIATMLEQIVKYVIEPGSATDRVLDGPTSEVWIDPWVQFLTKAGVKLHAGVRVKALETDAGRVTGVTATGPDGVDLHIDGDYYVAAVPVEVFRTLATADLRQRAPAIDKLDQLIVEWMNGIVFYLRRNVTIGRGHVILIDSSWSITCVSQPQFWRIPADRFGRGQTGGFISVDISNWIAPGQHTTTKPAEDCTRDEIARECWAQMKAHLPNLSDDDLLATIDAPADDRPWFLDIDIEPAGSAQAGTDAASRGRRTVAEFSALTPPLDTDAEPLLVNVKGSYELRPDADIGLPNLFLASDYVRTYTDLACMEGANEAGRRAVNAILNATGSTAPRCRLWPLKGLWALAPFRAIDWCLFKLGLPQIPVGTYRILFSPVVALAAGATAVLVELARWARGVKRIFAGSR
jgi:uncharacterized protein with NAD-binding domain and iron-sulfur cluster